MAQAVLGGPGRGRIGGGLTALLDPPCPDELFETADEALDQAMDFGRAVIDGKVPAIDAASLREIIQPGNVLH